MFLLGNWEYVHFKDMYIDMHFFAINKQLNTPFYKLNPEKNSTNYIQRLFIANVYPTRRVFCKTKLLGPLPTL